MPPSFCYGQLPFIGFLPKSLVFMFALFCPPVVHQYYIPIFLEQKRFWLRLTGSTANLSSALLHMQQPRKNNYPKTRSFGKNVINGDKLYCRRLLLRLRNIQLMQNRKIIYISVKRFSSFMHR